MGRFLFDLGSEFAAKPAGVRARTRAAPWLERRVSRGSGTSTTTPWPPRPIGSTSPSWARLGDELTRMREGQFLPSRRVDAAEAPRWSGSDSAGTASETFGALRDCFRLR